MKNAIGIDIGGTKISVTLGTSQGKILSQKLIPTRTGREVRANLKEILTAISGLTRGLSRKDLAGIGVGIPGPVDTGKGIVPRSPHLGGWEGLKLAKYLEKNTKLRTVMANDANAAALGEKNFGQGRGVRDFVYMTVSTGIGGGLVIGGKLIDGASYVAGEVGHMTIVADGDPCKCGKRGCLEAYASGTGIAAHAQRLIRQGKRFRFKGPVEAKTLGIAAQKGDALALAVYKRAGFYLGIGIANLLNVLNPQKIILGGGVLKSAPPVFWSSMIKACRRDAWPQAFRAVKIVPSRLKGHAGDLGALALAFEECPSKPASRA